MTTHTLTGTATDTMGAADTDTGTINSTASAPQRVVRRSFFENRIMWGSAIDSTIRGPFFTADTVGGPLNDIAQGIVSRVCPPDPITLSTIFEVHQPCRFAGCRIYKAPTAAGTSIPVTLWSGTTTGTVLASETIASWVSDGGGWYQVDFSPTVDLVPGVTYVIGFFAADGVYSFSQWVWHVQDTVVWPLHNRYLKDASGIRSDGSAVGVHTGSPAITFPTTHYAANYYIDPQVEWDDPLPGYSGGTEYHSQWVVPHTRHAFPVAVYFADPPYLSDYYDMGVNTLIAGSLQRDDYREAMNAMGNTMDWWPVIGTLSPAEMVSLYAEEPDIAESVVGYQLWDEPDLTGTFQPPATLRAWTNGMRVRDSTRPIYLGFGLMATRNQGFFGAPAGGAMLTLNEYWREWADCCDIIACDDYSWYYDNNASGNFGVWAYAQQVGRMREICDDAKPVWLVVETTSQIVGAPLPDDTVKAIWAALIAGARGIVLFDKRFASDFVTQDLNAIHANAPMKAAITALAAQLQTLGPALLSEDLGLVSTYTSTNTTEGPIGGTYGVPLHYTSRADDTYEYVFVQSIRPGATTATITIPTWTSEVVDVLGESRTETVSIDGLITDTFDNYQVHIYRRLVGEALLVDVGESSFVVTTGDEEIG